MHELLASNEALGIKSKEQILAYRFMTDARFSNPDKGYIDLLWVNQLIDTRLQGFAADIIVARLKDRDIQVDKVLGIPNCGTPLATSVAERLQLPLAPGRKGNGIPGAWKQRFVIDEEVDSFTTGQRSQFVFNGIERGDRVLLVDDFIALGYTTVLISRKLRDFGVSVNIAVYCAKVFQEGVSRLRESGIEPIYVLGINKTSDDKPVLTA